MHWSDDDISRFVLLLRFKTDVVDIKGIKATVPGDPQDAMVLATFIAGKADCLVSGDKALLQLSQDYPVVTPVEFVQEL